MKTEVAEQTLDMIYDGWNIVDLVVLENTEPGHDKAYILLTVKVDGYTLMIRFWGRHDNELVHKSEQIQGHEFEAILQQKLNKGYKPVEDMYNVRYKAYYEQILHSLKQIVLKTL
jgi:hypothetical protein